MRPSQKFWNIIGYIVLGMVGAFILAFLVYNWQYTVVTLAFLAIVLVIIYICECISDLKFYPNGEKEWNLKQITDAQTTYIRNNRWQHQSIKPKHNFLWRFNGWLDRKYNKEQTK